MKLNNEHKALFDTVKNFAINEIKPLPMNGRKMKNFLHMNYSKKWEISIYLELLKVKQTEVWG